LLKQPTHGRRRRAVFKRTLTNREIFRSSSENAPEVSFRRNAARYSDTHVDVSSLTAPKPNHIVLLVPCQPSTGLFPCNGHPVEDCTAEEPMDKLTVEPDAEEPKRKRKSRRKRAIHADELTAAPDDEKPEPSKRKRRQKRAVHVSSQQDDSNPQDSVEPADNHITEVQGLSSKRPKCVVETSDPCRRNACRSMVCRRKVCRRNALS